MQATSHCSTQTIDHKKTMRIIFFHVVLQWASINDYIFYIVLQGSEQRQQKFEHCKTRAQIAGVWRWKDSHATIKFFRCCQSKWWWQWARSAKSPDNRHIFDVTLQKKQRQLYFWCYKKRSYCQGVWDDSESTIARHKNTTIKFLICCWSKDDGNVCIAREQATIANAQSACNEKHRNDTDIVNA